jgi:hypothetical protein
METWFLVVPPWATRQESTHDRLSQTSRHDVRVRRLIGGIEPITFFMPNIWAFVLGAESLHHAHSLVLPWMSIVDSTSSSARWTLHEFCNQELSLYVYATKILQPRIVVVCYLHDGIAVHFLSSQVWHRRSNRRKAWIQSGERPIGLIR